MFMVAIICIVVLTIPLFGGRLGNLARVRLRHSWAVALAVALQFLVITFLPHGDAAVHAITHIVTYAIAAVFVVANRTLLGMWLAAAGASLNALVIAVNGGVMPARPEAVRSSGIEIVAGEFENSRPLADAKLAFLGDVFSIPDEVPLLANVFSVGDVLILLSASLILHWIGESRLIPRKVLARRPPPFGTADDETAVGVDIAGGN
jgi:hypothetical protein